MEVIKLILDGIAGIAWPAVILAIALSYRPPIYVLLFHIGGIAGRAATANSSLRLE
jgi:hypothetical protein